MKVFLSCRCHHQRLITVLSEIATERAIKAMPCNSSPTTLKQPQAHSSETQTIVAVFLYTQVLAEAGTDLGEAFRLASLTYDRANPDLGTGSLNQAEYASQTAVLNFIFDERQREFMFEGKRYFDIIRRINHHRSDFRNIVNSYLLPKYADLDQSTVSSKLSAYDALFMPINDTEMRANLLLKQNPFYATSSDINLD